MKKFLGTFFSIIITFSISSIVLAANHVTPYSAKISKQVIL
jgi:hypothetical protein